MLCAHVEICCVSIKQQEEICFSSKAVNYNIGLWHLSRLSNNINVLNQHFCFSCRGAEVSDCGKYLILTPHEGCAPVNRLFYCDLENQDGIKGEIS